MKCLNDCDKEAVGRSKYCGDSCKVLYNRKRKQQSVNSEGVTSEKFDGFDVKHNGSRPGLFALPIIALTTQDTDEQEAGGRKKSKKVIASYPGCFDPTLKHGPAQSTKSDKANTNNLAKSPFKGLDDPIIITDVLPEEMEWLNTDQLKQAGLKHNHVPIPGDEDYAGCVPQPATAAPVDEVMDDAVRARPRQAEPMYSQ